MAKRGRPPQVENRPDADEILEALLSPDSNYAQICRAYGLSREALDTFRAKKITKPIQKLLDLASKKGTGTEYLDVLAKLTVSIEKAYEMLLAADLWLRDPDDPTRYNLNPRTHEVEVVTEEPNPMGTGVIRRTVLLSHLLARVEQDIGITVIKGETKIADPRKLLLDAVATLKPVLELLGKATGQIKPDPATTINVLVASPAWIEIRGAIVAALQPHPEALSAVRLALASGKADA